MRRSKKYLEAKKLVDSSKVYTIKEASELIKKLSTTKFDSSIELAFNLNLDTKQADQQLRGTVSLPHGNGKTKTILAVTNTKQEEAKQAGADFVGGKDLLEKIQKENWFGFDVIVATPDMMGELGKMGKLLGPKGLMPNPKTGTVTMNIGEAVKEIKNGKITYRTDKEGNVHCMIGKVSFSAEDIADNIRTVLELIHKVKPSAVKGTYIKSMFITTTMGPSIKVSSELRQ